MVEPGDTGHRPGIRSSVAAMTRDVPHFFSYFQNRPLPWAIHSRDSSIRFWRVCSVFASAIQTTYSLRNDGDLLWKTSFAGSWRDSCSAKVSGMAISAAFAGFAVRR